MKGWNKTFAICLVALAAAPALAQEEAEPARPDAGRNGMSAETIEVEMRQAEEELADAAARVAELSSRRLPMVVDIERHIRSFDRPMLGVTIGAGEEDGPVEGVTIQGVTPGSPAAEAGLRAGDVLTAVNGESLSADDDAQANRKLLDFMEGIETGDVLDVEYLRDGKEATVTVEPRSGQAFNFAFNPGGRWNLPIAPGAPGARWFGLYMDGGGWADMEMVSLTKELGRYFGTDSGLLVVRAPADEALKLEDGDVIQRIDGREPTSVSHALRILGSYQSGETLEIEIMRDKERQTLSVEMPDQRQGAVQGVAPMPPPVHVDRFVAPRTSTRTEEDRI